MELLKKIRLERQGIGIRLPRKCVLNKEQRAIPVIISLTTFPPRIKSSRATLVSLLNQEYLPDKILLWLAKEQFPNGAKDIPEEILELEKYGVEIKYYQRDIKPYKKLIPALKEYPEAVIVTVDDDRYYSKRFLKKLIEEHEKHPDEIICNEITHPRLDKNERLRTNREPKDYRGTSSYGHKLIGGGGVLYPPKSLDETVLDEDAFMELAPTNDDIWFWAMAVKKGTKSRLAANPEGFGMTDFEVQNKVALHNINKLNNIYENVNNLMLEEYPIILQRLKSELEV